MLLNPAKVSGDKYPRLLLLRVKDCKFVREEKK